MSCLLRGLKWPKTGLRKNRVISQFLDVFKHSPKNGWWPRIGGFTLIYEVHPLISWDNSKHIYLLIVIFRDKNGVQEN